MIVYVEMSYFRHYFDENLMNVGNPRIMYKESSRSFTISCAAWNNTKRDFCGFNSRRSLQDLPTKL